MTSRRHLAGLVSGLLLSLVCAALFVLAATLDLFVVPPITPGEPPSLTIRIPLIGTYRDTVTGGASYRLMRITQPRGDAVSPRRARLIRAYEESRRPPSKGLLVGLSVASILLFFLYTSYLRVLGAQTRFLRPQLVLAMLLVTLILVAKAMMLVTAWSPLWTPLLAIVGPIALRLGRRVAAATSVAGAIALSLLTPVDLVLLIVATSQGLALSATLRPHSQMRMLVPGTIVSAFAGMLAYAALSLLLRQYVQIGQLQLESLDLTMLLESDFIASFGSAIVGGLLAIVVSPLAQRALGQVSRARLSALAEFENPLLRQLAAKAPGTWAHSLSMANMAEMAANAIHANGLLVRVGAYYHDVGKAIQPEYFIENQAENNPHDRMEPEVSADAIVSHVPEGLKLARKSGLPEAVAEFIYTHHGIDRLEYFWHKKLKAAGNSNKLSEGDFRYQGHPPQTRETGILALCDSVEAAARSMDSNEPQQIQQLVRQIVFTKLLSGVVDQSGLTVAELRKVTESMIETLRSAMHKRVKYPWQEGRGGGQSEQSGENNQSETNGAGTRANASGTGLDPRNSAHSPGSPPDALTQSQRTNRPRGATQPLGQAPGESPSEPDEPMDR